MQHCSLMSHHHLQKQHTARLVRDGHRYKSLLLNSLHCFCPCLIPTHYHRYLFTVIQFTPSFHPVTLQSFHPLSFLCYTPTFDHIVVIVIHLPIATQVYRPYLLISLQRQLCCPSSQPCHLLPMPLTIHTYVRNQMQYLSFPLFVTQATYV